MEPFVREYAAKSILPHLYNAPGAGGNLLAYGGRYDNYETSNNNNDSNANSNFADVGNSNNFYFIAPQQQLLHNESDYDAAVLPPDVAYNDTSSAAAAAPAAAATSALSSLSSLKLAATALAAGVAAAAKNSAETVSGFAQHSRRQLLLPNASGTVAAGIGIGIGTEAAITTTLLYEGYTDFMNFSCEGESLNTVSTLNASGAGNESVLTAAEEDSPLSSVYFKTAVYLLYIPIFVFALLGNGTVCYIVQSTPRMRTVTNFFIANLAVGDILMSLFCVPFSFVSIFILGYWPFGIALCYLVNYSQVVSVLVSAYTLVAISIDRYIAIMWPLRPRITKRYAKFIIAGVWGIALVTAFPIPIVSKLMQPDIWHVHCHRYICREEWPSNEQYYYYTLALFTLQFVVPLAVLIFTYTRIALAVWGKRPPGEAENSRDQRMARSKRKMIKMMVMVVIVFTICWLPFNILVLLLNDEEFKEWPPLPYFWFAFHWLAMSHSCYNPIIYCYMNARFRGGFLQIIYRVPGLRRCCCLRRYLRSRGGGGGGGGGDRSYEATGEMTFKFSGDKNGGGGGLLRKPKIRIRNGRCIPPATGKHLHHLHQHPAKASSEFYASESVFMCGNHSVAVVPTT